MTAENFVYWLQGFFEIAESNHPALTLSNAQVEIIKRHLNLVFIHDIDPKAGGPEVQEKLNKAHNPPSVLPKRPPGVRC